MKRISLLFASIAVLAGTALTQESPTIIGDEGGVVRLRGHLNMDNPNIPLLSDNPLILLEDQTAFIARDPEMPLSRRSQFYGRWVSDFYQGGQVQYELLLPIIPQGTVHDFDGDGVGGVQVFQSAFYDNSYGDITLDQNETQGWSISYSSARVSDAPSNYGEIIGGKLVVYASDEQQGFPAGFGDDGKLFTEDDPLMTLPQGWSVAVLDSEPFSLVRSQTANLDLFEPEINAPDDFSELSYTEAFDALIEKAKREYAFNELKGMDWDALAAEFRPRIEEAEANEDAVAFQLAMDDFAKSIPDGHVGAPSDASQQYESERIAGGLGFAVRELSDGRVLVIYIQEDSPAAEAGITFGTEITAIDGVPISEAIDAAYSPNAPYSLESLKRVEGSRFVTRFPLSKGEVEVSFKNGDEDEQSVTLAILGERDSLRFTRQFIYGQSLPVPLETISWSFYPETNIGYIAVTSFVGNWDLFKRQWEEFLEVANALTSPAIIIDLRNNGGGFSNIGAAFTSYLIDEPVPLPIDEEYNKEIDGFFRPPFQETELEPFPVEERRYAGEVLVLVSPNCASACEFFAYYLQASGAEVMGVYGTNGIAGGWIETFMPADLVVSLPTFRSVLEDGTPIIEGVGVQPTIPVAITEENMASTDDLVLAEALAYLTAQTSLEEVDGGTIALGESLEGTITPRQRVNVAFNTGDGGVVDIVVEGDAQPFVVILSPTGDLLADGTSPSDPGWEGLELPPNFDLILQLRTEGDEGEGSYKISVVAP